MLLNLDLKGNKYIIPVFVRFKCYGYWFCNCKKRWNFQKNILLFISLKMFVENIFLIVFIVNVVRIFLISALSVLNRELREIIKNL